MLEGNLLIRASAGTGKTFALATRYLRLMLLDKVDPAKIIALTFSRAAAQEIYTKILERLWKAAENVWISSFPNYIPITAVPFSRS